MNLYRTFTLRHSGVSLTLRADAVCAFFPDEHGGTRVFVSNDDVGWVVAESRDDVLRILESECHS